MSTLTDAALPACLHTEQLWNIAGTHGHCKRCGKQFGADAGGVAMEVSPSETPAMKEPTAHPLGVVIRILTEEGPDLLAGWKLDCAARIVKALASPTHSRRSSASRATHSDEIILPAWLRDPSSSAPPYADIHRLLLDVLGMTGIDSRSAPDYAVRVAAWLPDPPPKGQA